MPGQICQYGIHFFTLFARMNATRAALMPEPVEAPARAAALIEAARRITLKVGSSLLISSSGDGVRQDWLDALAEDIATLRGKGRQIVLVSSGAVALGRRRLKLKSTGRLALKQAAAASGQLLLMRAWEEALAVSDPDRTASADVRGHRIAAKMAERARHDRGAARQRCAADRQ